MTSTNPRQALDLAIAEAKFVRMIIDLAHLKGWLVHHDRPARTNKGWATPIQGDKGFPDLVLARQGSPIIFAEVKSEKGKPSPEQTNWLWVLGRAGVSYYIWKPSDWERVLEILEWESWRPGGVMKR